METEVNSKQGRERRSMVRFGPTTVVEYVPTRGEISKEEGDRIWWRSPDFKEFIHITRYTGREIRRKGLADGVSIAYQEARQAVAQINEEVLQQMISNHLADDKLVYWCKFGHTRRGLELHASDVLRNARWQAADKTTSIVLALSNKVDNEVIRNASQASSRAARLFARMMGEADASAVEQLRRRSSPSTTTQSRLITRDKHAVNLFAKAILCQRQCTSH